MAKGESRSLELSTHRAKLPGKELFNYILPFDAADKAGLAGTLLVNARQNRQESPG